MDDLADDPLIEQLRSRVELKDRGVENAKDYRSCGTFSGFSDIWDFRVFTNNFHIKICSIEDDEVVFDMINVATPLANCVRRVLIAEVPTIAIEKVFMYQNTSIIQDEILASRLGLSPLRADPSLFNYRDYKALEGDSKNTLDFELKIRCSHRPGNKPTTVSSASASGASEREQYVNQNVYTSHLKWIPRPGQTERMASDPPRPVHNDILLAKLRPGQAIELNCHAMKGIGRTHAKWSPVATASYRMMPEITLKKPVEGNLALKLQSCFPPGVISLYEDPDTKLVTAQVGNSRLDTGHRDVFTHPELADLVTISRIKDHFIFSVESTGAYADCTILMCETFRTINRKCETLLLALNKATITVV